MKFGALLALSTDNNQGVCGEVRELAANHLEGIRRKIADLQAMEHILADAVRRCDAGETSGCPLIDTLHAK
jgi:MerR family transcriptional regulator, mercuric resistance operon regulatory protein